MSAGLVVELTPATLHQAGRPAIPLAVAPGTVAALGCEINVDFLGVRAVDLAGNLVGESFERLNLRQADPGQACAALIRHAQRVVSAVLDHGMRPLGACLALPGIADHPSGPLRLAPNLGWRDVDIHQLMGDAITQVGGPGAHDQPVWTCLVDLLVRHLDVDNEANLAARTELSRDHNASFIYVSGETGIGAAIVVNGQVFTGLHGWAGEIGHIVVDPRGPTCACGANGCLEMYAGQRSLMAAAGLDPAAGVSALIDAHRNGSTLAQAAIDRAAEALGIALANSVNLVDVSRIVLGGSFAPLTELLRDRLAAEMARRVLSARWVGLACDIQASTSGDYPAATGSALAVLDQAVTDPASTLWTGAS
jgi:predicted NBD/HSP70 family sugar kinase